MSDDKNKLTTIEQSSKQLEEQTQKIVTDLIAEEDPQRLQDLSGLFNLAHTKKAVIRAVAYDELLDGITAQMKERVTKRADQFTHKELLDYMNTIGAALDKAQKTVKDVDTSPAIQFNQQNNITIVGEPELSRESRMKVTDAIESILKKLKNSDTNTEDTDENLVLLNEDIDTDEESDDIEND